MIDNSETPFGCVLLLGFQVGGLPPRTKARMQSDLFELRQAAVQCAQLLVAEGWSNVTCDEVREEFGERSMHEIRWQSP